MPEHNNPEIGTFELDALVSINKLIHNNKPILHHVFQRKHQTDKQYVLRRYGYFPLLILQNNNGEYAIVCSDIPDSKKKLIEITIDLDDENFRDRAFEEIKQTAQKLPDEAKYNIDGLNKANVKVRPVYGFRFTAFDHGGVSYPIVETQTRNFLANTQGHNSIDLYLEVDAEVAQKIMDSPQKIKIVCEYSTFIVQQDQNKTTASITDITKSNIYANLQQQASGKFIKRTDVRKLLNTLMTEVVIYSEIDRPDEYQKAGDILIDKLLAIFDRNSQQMELNVEAYLQSQELSGKDLQADVLTGEVHESENTTKKSGGGGFLSKIFSSVTSVIPIVKATNVVKDITKKSDDNKEDSGNGNFSSEKTNKEKTSWTGEKISPKDIVLVKDILSAMEQDLKLSHTVVFNTRASIADTHTIDFKNYDYTPKKETPPPPPPTRPSTITYKLPNGVDMEMIWVAGGSFDMGGSDNEAQAPDSEKPVHKVTLNGFYIAKYPTTQAQYKAIMNYNPSQFKGDNLPVENVSWEDAVEFCHRLSDLTNKTYRLSTEAEWEYAARGGNKSRNYKYAGSNNIDTVAWYEQKGGATTRPVGQKNPNELGLYDMSGNVWEWCNDWYAADYYKNSPANNPTGPASGAARVLRGGCWRIFAQYCRTATRNINTPSIRNCYIGFRLVFVP